MRPVSEEYDPGRSAARPTSQTGRHCRECKTGMRSRRSAAGRCRFRTDRKRNGPCLRQRCQEHRGLAPLSRLRMLSRRTACSQLAHRDWKGSSSGQTDMAARRLMPPGSSWMPYNRGRPTPGSADTCQRHSFGRRLVMWWARTRRALRLVTSSRRSTRSQLDTARRGSSSEDRCEEYDEACGSSADEPEGHALPALHVLQAVAPLAS